MSRYHFCIAMLALLMSCQANPERSIDVREHKQYPKLREEVDGVVAQVQSAAGPDLYNHLQRLVAFDVFAIEAVADLLEEPNPRLRSNALFVLSHFNDETFPREQEIVADALEEGLEDPHRLVRYEAATGLLMRQQWQAIPVLFEGLEDDDPAVRLNCHRILAEATSEDFGFVASAHADQRHDAVQRWRSWYDRWESERG
jgi:hypothetical protein